MAADEKWYFTKEQLTNTPSRRCGIDADKELSYRQQAANFIQDMGQRLVVTQLCINTAIVYMHRFYVFHSLSHFHRNSIAAAALFLAAKVEEQPRKLEHVIKMAHMCLHRDQPPPDVRSEQYLEQAQDLVFNENVLLQTLGFDVAIDHPHTHVVRCCQLVKASKDLAQTSYFMASNSLHLTTMCLQYKPTVVACFCIHLACKWSNWEIPQSNEGKHWFWYVDRSVTSELLQQLTAEFLHIFDKCPSRLKRKIMSISANQSPSMNHPSLPNSPFDAEPRKVQSPASAVEGGPTFHSNKPHHTDKQEEKKQQQIPSAPRASFEYREYREKKERERLERDKTATPATSTQTHAVDVNKHHSHHHKTVSSSGIPSKYPGPPAQKIALHHNHHHRPDMKITQPLPQRHSTLSAQSSREPTRDPNKQRAQREYNSSGNMSSVHSHAHVVHQSKDTSAENPLPDIATQKTEMTTASQDTSSHGTVQDKLSNNNHNVQRLSGMDSKHQSHDKRVYDPRHKTVEHRKDGEQKAYSSSKYSDPSRERQRKPDILEQRCEEVRKLIEKPLPPPKPSVEIQYQTTAQKQQLQQQPYHGKYAQQSDRLQPSSGSGSLLGDTKSHLATLPQIKSPTTGVPSNVASSITSSSLSQLPQKSISAIKTTVTQHPIHVISQTSKDTIKNGNSQSSCVPIMNNIDDPKAEKRPRHEDLNEQQQSQQNMPQTPPSKHKSLFSPEKVPITREPHSQRPKSKQKTPPSAVKVPTKQEHFLDNAVGLVSPFASPLEPQQQVEMVSIKRSASDVSTASHKKHRATSSSENEQQVKPKIDDTSSLEAMKMLGRVPELIQPIRDNPSNGRSTSVANDLKPPELIKPFEPEPTVPHYGSMITNGLNTNVEQQQQQQHHHRYHHQQRQQQQDQIDYLSPMKSAQSISALLQEPLAPMPSLLQGIQQYGQVSSQQIHQEQIVQQEQQQQTQSQPTSHLLLFPDSQSNVQSQCVTLSSSIGETSIASTVDISVLSAPMQDSTDTDVISSMQTTVQQSATTHVPVEEKKSEHHKSEKKKKKEKHKHKDKEKSKEKHKHKHKDKDKDKHRERDKNDESLPAAPIKITIPKEKLNLSGETAASSGSIVIPDKNKSPQGSGLKLKILVDRSKAGENGAATSNQAQPVTQQAPLKMKIRTDAIWRSSGGNSGAPTSSSITASTVSGLSDYVPVDGRKRERVDLNESLSVVPPPSKKQLQQQQQHQQHQQLHQQQQQQQHQQNQQQQQHQQMSSMGNYAQHRTGERQNGRHYSSGSNNKVRGGGRGGRQYIIGRGSLPSAGCTTGYYQQDNITTFVSNNNARNSHHNTNPSAHVPLNNRSDSASYGRIVVGGGGGGGVGCGGGGGSGGGAGGGGGNGGHSVAQSQAPPSTADSSYFFANFPPAAPMYNAAAAAGYIYDSATAAAMYYHQQYQQQQYSVYPGGSVIMTADGAIDTSVPPPSLVGNMRHQQLRQSQQQSVSKQDNMPPPLPSGPPPSSSPPPPPPPE